MDFEVPKRNLDIFYARKLTSIYLASWSRWSTWSTCSESCGYGSKLRTGMCPTGKICFGTGVKSKWCYEGACRESKYIDNAIVRVGMLAELTSACQP